MQEKIVEYLKSKYHPIALILYGSQANGRAKPQSDWDFAVLVDKKIQGGSEVVDGHYVDADILIVPISTEEVIRRFDGAFQTAMVVFDTDSEGKTLVDDVQAIYAKGRNLSIEERGNRINFITRRLRKLEDNVGEPGTFFYHLGVFYEKAIQYWFELRYNRWRLSPGTALRVIEEQDPLYFKLLEVLYSAVSPEEKLQVATKVVNYITE